LIELTPLGAEVYARAELVACEITQATLAPLGEDERGVLLRLLRRLT